ncbi:hypothetical protein [Polymorphospora sp. NPDC050346]|uniref:hypothetical protein n=1 Tax=Polymorphospora sp. NPDC050346 TaxID=3155780 RepID=UPI0033DD67AC
MTTGQLRDEAQRAGIGNTDQMDKDDLIGALGGTTNARQGGGQTQKDPRPKGVRPQEYKNIPGNQT